MKLLTAAKSRPLLRKVQILLCSGQNAKVLHKIVFGRRFQMLVILFSLSCLYRFGIHWNDKQQVVKIEQLEAGRIRKVWKALYQNKSFRKSMEKAFKDTGR